MTLLNSDQLAWMRGVVNDSFPDLCTVQRPTETQDASGNTVQSFQSLATSVACRIVAMTAGQAESVVAGGVLSRIPYTVTVPQGQDVQAKDRLVITSQGNLTLEVLEPLGPRSWELYRQVLAVKVG